MLSATLLVRRAYTQPAATATYAEPTSAPPSTSPTAPGEAPYTSPTGTTSSGSSQPASTSPTSTSTAPADVSVPDTTTTPPPPPSCPDGSAWDPVSSSCQVVYVAPTIEPIPAPGPFRKPTFWDRLTDPSNTLFRYWIGGLAAVGIVGALVGAGIARRT